MKFVQTSPRLRTNLLDFEMLLIRQAQLLNRGWPWLAVLPSRLSSRQLLITSEVSLLNPYSLHILAPSVSMVD